jgi:hypothetical protein
MRGAGAIAAQERRIVTISSMRCAAVFLALTCIVAADGCARLRGRTTDERSTAAPLSADVEGEFKLVWATLRDVLRDSPVEIYTRDKRGTFEVFEDKGRAFLTPRRLRLVITLRPVSVTRTHITVETFPESYTVQLLTRPAWRPADFGDNSLAKEILNSVQERIRDAKG